MIAYCKQTLRMMFKLRFRFISVRRIICAIRRRVVGQNQKYYQRFPDDVEAVQRIVTHLIKQPEGGVRTPSGNLLTPRSLQLLGLSGANLRAKLQAV